MDPDAIQYSNVQNDVIHSMADNIGLKSRSLCTPTNLEMVYRSSIPVSHCGFLSSNRRFQNFAADYYVNEGNSK